MTDNSTHGGESRQPYGDTNAKDALLRLRLDEPLLRELEEAMEITGFTNKSAFIRKAIFNEIKRARRRQELEALEWEQRKKAIRRDGSDDPFPKEQ